ncbi:hypothetical protein SI65_09177 [Aspergillus cristatus]|uniref:Protein kinase domain-containing protein n=1 Tax=Aspergillus cristatus TaxID=573508 RepID=A0A1E3B480_ASPCR|nr:hypothetical protein SI65_09177 [Aspergillus cristatus]
MTGKPSTPDFPQHVSRSESIVKGGTPYAQTGRSYVGLKSPGGGICALEMQNGVPVSFISHCAVTEEHNGLKHLRQVTHTNLLGLKEVFLQDGIAFFLYDAWGITLEELQRLSHVFRLGEVEVATICKGILQGLEYMHNALGICHGDLSCSTVLINDEGNVKIAGIGESMVRKSSPQGKFQDVGAVCDIARTLLDFDNITGVRGTLGLLAVDFIAAPLDVTVEYLLQHSFLRIAVPHCVRPVNILCTIASQCLML